MFPDAENGGRRVGRSSACPLPGTISRALKTLRRHALSRRSNAHAQAPALRIVAFAPRLAEQAGTGVTGRSWVGAEPPPPSKCFPPREKAWSLMKPPHEFKQQPNGDSALFRCLCSPHIAVQAREHAHSAAALFTHSSALPQGRLQSTARTTQSRAWQTSAWFSFALPMRCHGV